MLLATPDEVVARNGMQQGTAAFVTHAEAALHSATAELEARLGYSFQRAERIDYFGGCYSNDGSSTSPLVRLNLTGSFVDPNATFEVYQSTNGQRIAAIADANSLLLDPEEEEYAVELITGRAVLFFAPALAEFRRSMAVHYTHGFVASGEYYGGVPDGLKEAAISLAIGAMRAFSAPNGKVDITAVSDAMHRIRVTQVNQYIRSRMVGNNPQFTEVVTA